MVGMILESLPVPGGHHYARDLLDFFRLERRMVELADMAVQTQGRRRIGLEEDIGGAIFRPKTQQTINIESHIIPFSIGFFFRVRRLALTRRVLPHSTKLFSH